MATEADAPQVAGVGAVVEAEVGVADVAGAVEPHWLDDHELRVWRAFMLMIAKLPSALEAQTQRDSGLSFVEYYVLAGLSDAPQWTMRMSELAVFTYAELSRLSHVMTRLERRGLVRRQPDPTDGRYTNAILTDRGYALLVQAAPCHVASARELVVDALDADQLQQLGAISAKIVASIDARLERETRSGEVGRRESKPRGVRC